MSTIRTALLFVGNPSLAVEHFVESLGSRLIPLGINAEEISPRTGSIISFRAAGITISISANQTAMSAENFTGALDSPLSKPMIGVLSDTLARHTRHIEISVSEPDPSDDTPAPFLTRLQIAHATTSLLAEWHMPAAVYWSQSNQLVTGAQYLQLTKEPTPWALFANARITYAGEIDQMVRLHGIQLDEAADFIGRPIKFTETHYRLDQIHAAALSFLRHAVDTGAPMPDGQTFGPEGGSIFKVTHRDACEKYPDGVFELSVVQSDAGEARGVAARPPRAKIYAKSVPLPPMQPLHGIAPPNPRERTRSMAISYLMLVILPPVGAILLMSNAVFGSNVWRTGVVALASVTFAVIVGSYTFMKNGQETALLFEPELIRSSTLSE